MMGRGVHGGFGNDGRGFQPYRQPASSGHLRWTIATPPGLPPECGRHPLADRASSLAHHHCLREITAAFDAIEPVLRGLAPQQFAEGFARRGAAEVLSRLHLDLPTELFAADWAAPLDMGILYARCVLGTFRRLIERADARGLAYHREWEAIENLEQGYGFHAIDITPCADARLVGAIDYNLRIPPSVVAYRKPAPGAVFDMEQSVGHWERTELRRWRNAAPDQAFSTTQYLKMCIYPFSDAAPADRRCAALDGDGHRAVAALLARLRQFGQALRLIHGESASVATLLVGVDTDTQAIRVHVPDAHGTMHAGRHLNGHILYNGTSALSHKAAKGAIQNAVAICGGVSANHVASAGIRRLCGYLLETNIAHIDFRREWHSPHAGSSERLLVVGDAVDEAPMGNFAFQAQTVGLEEGAAEIDNGVTKLRGFHEQRRLAIPLMVHVRVDPLMPGAVHNAQGRARHLANRIRNRYDHLVSSGVLHIEAVIRDSDGALLPIDVFAADRPDHAALTNTSQF